MCTLYFQLMPPLKLLSQETTLQETSDSRNRHPSTATLKMATHLAKDIAA